ncbi:hypothetical protein C8R47DRAFT_276676 [Mycena vitilis]|nr:hypothetical protein C8R47DRAFT_276676 [Mycena vitilis]
MQLGTLQWASYAGLTFATCEIILTYRTERTYIWRNPQGSTSVKRLYLLSRYLAFATHITNTVLSTLVRKYTVIPHHLCRIAVQYQGIVLFVLLGILDVILMLRVYALYNRRFYLAAIFVILLVLRFIFPATAFFRGLPRQQFNASCLVLSAGREAAVYLLAGGELFVQMVVLGLTLSRHVSATRGGWGNPLFSLLSRDGSLVFSATAVGMIAIIAVCLNPADGAHLVFPLLVIIMSSAGCHLIMNMQKMADPIPLESDPVLTTMNGISSGRDENGGVPTRIRQNETCMSEICSVHFN